MSRGLTTASKIDELMEELIKGSRTHHNVLFDAAKAFPANESDIKAFIKRLVTYFSEQNPKKPQEQILSDELLYIRRNLSDKLNSNASWRNVIRKLENPDPNQETESRYPNQGLRPS